VKRDTRMLRRVSVRFENLGWFEGTVINIIPTSVAGDSGGEGEIFTVLYDDGQLEDDELNEGDMVQWLPIA